MEAILRPYKQPTTRALDYIRPREAILAMLTGAAIAAGAKYIAAAFLVLWLLAGGQ